MNLEYEPGDLCLMNRDCVDDNKIDPYITIATEENRWVFSCVIVRSLTRKRPVTAMPCPMRESAGPIICRV